MSENSILVVADEEATAAAGASAISEELPDVPVDTLTDGVVADERLRSARIFATFDPTAEQLASAEAAEWIHAFTAGVDDYPVDVLRERGVALTNGRGVNAEPVAEQALSFMLAFERNLHRALRQQARGEWEWFGGHEFRGKTVGVVGVGAIGRRIATLSDSLGTTVLGVNRDVETSVEGVEELFAPEDLDAVLDRVDYLVLACPLTDATTGLLGADEFARLSDSAVVVNVARGEVIVEDALVAALEAGEIRGAALDVFETEPLPSTSPLWDRDDVIITPHMAGSTPAFWARNADIIATNYRRFRDGTLDALANRVV